MSFASNARKWWDGFRLYLVLLTTLILSAGFSLSSSGEPETSRRRSISGPDEVRWGLNWQIPVTPIRSSGIQFLSETEDPSPVGRQSPSTQGWGAQWSPADSSSDWFVDVRAFQEGSYRDGIGLQLWSGVQVDMTSQISCQLSAAYQVRSQAGSWASVLGSDADESVSWMLEFQFDF